LLSKPITDSLDVLRLPPAREWAMSRKRTSARLELAAACASSRQQRGLRRDRWPGGPDGAAGGAGHAGTVGGGLAFRRRAGGDWPR